MQQKRPLIGITMGDPVGIGPEIVIPALNRSDIYKVCHPLVFGDLRLLSAINEKMHQPVTLVPLDPIQNHPYQFGTLNVVSLSELNPTQITWGRPTAITGKAMLSYIETAIEYALSGKIQGIVTGPINKTAMRMAGSEFTGHTELLAARSKTNLFRMMMAGNKLRVVLTTIHIPLSSVPSSLSTDSIYQTITITHQALKERFAIPDPRIGVAGLNPHAGEAGLFGKEEADLIVPAIEQAHRQGLQVKGPYPPDTIFNTALKGEFDAVVCMYHDQGLIPFKLIHFENGVNTTLGLPFIRTSVDHGTAYDIAGKGLADAGSLVEAIKMAAFQAHCRQ